MKRIEKLAKRSELVLSCLKSGRGQKHAESKKPALGAMSLHLGSRMLRKPWVLTELQRSFQTGVSQWVMNNATKIKSNDERSV